MAWVPCVNDIVDFETKENEVRQHMNDADLIFSLDYNEPSRMGEAMGEVLRAASGNKVMIDHHLNPENYDSRALRAYFCFPQKAPRSDRKMSLSSIIGLQAALRNHARAAAAGRRQSRDYDGNGEVDDEDGWSD